MTEAENEDILVTHAIESREYGTRMRFPADPDTTRRLQNLRLDVDSPIPWWRRLLRWVFRI